MPADKPFIMTEGRAFVLAHLAKGETTGRKISIAARENGINRVRNGYWEWSHKHLKALRDAGYVTTLGMHVDGCMLHRITAEGQRALARRNGADAVTCDGAEAIAAERLRQMQVEGWAPAGDDAYTEGQLGRAAMVYVELAEGVPLAQAALNWPWDIAWLKHDPEDPARSLVKAGALIAAEYDRMKRLKAMADV